VGWVASGELGGALAGFVASIFSAKLLGVREFGMFGIAAALAATGGAFLAVPLEDVAARRYQQLVKHSHDAKRTWSVYYWTNWVFGLLRFAILLAAIPAFAVLYPSLISATAAILVAAITISTNDSTIISLLNVRQRGRPIGIARLTAPTLRLGLLALLQPHSASELALIQLAGSVASSAYLIWLARSYVTRHGCRLLWISELRASRRVLGHLFVASSLRGLTGNVDQLLVGRWLGFRAAGIYRLAASIANAPTIIASVLRFVKAPDIRDAAIAENLYSLRRTLFRLSGAYALLGIGTLTGWLIVGRPLVDNVLGVAFAQVYSIAFLLMVARALDYVTAWSKVLPVALNRGNLALMDATWYAASPIPFLAAGIHLLGLAGAGYAMVLVSGLASVAWFSYVCWGLPKAIRSRAGHDQQ
jgi:O-antigen/teichoic acid export membrane protein